MKDKIINKIIEWIDDYGDYFSWKNIKQLLIILVLFYLIHSATHWIFQEGVINGKKEENEKIKECQKK